IQLDALLKLNKMSKGEEPKVGELINLKKPIKVKPQLRTTPIQNKTETIPNKQETIKTTSIEVKTTVSTSKDTIYKNIPKQNTSVDEEKVLSWEEGTKLVENNPVKPFPDTKIEEKIEPIKNTATNLETIEVSEKKTEVSTPIIELKKVDPNASVHLVEKGDTLYNISKRYGITVAQLIEWNNIQDNVVKLGTYLKVK
ncbi:MAG TPA: LysM peptidoglycan-binding domain-containing protein, partial [Chitinophagales bacterium]|nr:LysM peptidoglycan-binding domain-containing protein [Chitinophagales bacterium]